jgi:cysteine desulfurase
MKKIYLDYNASTPIAPEVADAMRPCLEDHFGNPSAGHWAGKPAREAVERARGRVAGLLGCMPEEIVFTSGGSESNNHAIKGTFLALREKGGHIITAATEHPAVIAPCRFLETLGAQVTILPVDRTGQVDPDDVKKAIGDKTILVSLMHANNETGTLHPIEEVSKITQERGVWLHTDAAQSAGKIPTDVGDLGVDMLSVAGHKLYGPKGVGALYLRSGVTPEPLVHRAGHESGRRAGTENLVLDVGLGAACELAREHLGMESTRKLRDRFWEELRAAFGDRVVQNGHPTERLPNTLNVSFVGRDGTAILKKLEEHGVAASTGAACHAGSVKLSPVLEAMGVPPETGMGALRFSLGRPTTWAELENVLGILSVILSR